MLNVLLNVKIDGIRTDLPHFDAIFDYLEENHHLQKLDYTELTDKTTEEIKQYFLNKYNAIPNNIIMKSHLTKILDINLPEEINVVVLIDDLHHQGSARKNRTNVLMKCSKILSTYGYCFHKYYQLKTPVYFFPHCAVYDIGFNENPVDKLLVSGRLHNNIYPFRHLLHQLSKKHPKIDYLTVNFKYVIQEDSPNLIYGKKYVEKLNQYLACFTCDASVNRPYIVTKHFEILLSGSLLVSGNPNTKKYFEKLGLIDGIHYVSVNQSNYQEEINKILDPNNRDNIDQIRRTGYLFAKKYHTVASRGGYLQQILGGKEIELHTDGIDNSQYHLQLV